MSVSFSRVSLLALLLMGGLLLAMPENSARTRTVESRPAPERFAKARFDGERFYNQVPFEEHGRWEVLKWRLTRSSPPWPEWIESEQKKIPQSRVTGNRLSITFINHATLLIQYEGVNMLTDPTWNDRASPVTTFGPKRIRNPGVKMDDLPDIDLVLISHNHYDHLDLHTLSMLSERFAPTVLVGLGNTPLLKEAGLQKIHEMDWWDSIEYGGLRIYFTPTQHFSARGLFDRMETLWGGFVVQGRSGNIYFAGDTASGPHDRQLREKFKGFRVALLPIGGYKPRWFMKAVHMNPAEAVRAHELLNSDVTIGMHFGTFAHLSDEGMEEPLEDVRVALDEAGVDPSRFITLEFGQTKSDL